MEAKLHTGLPTGDFQEAGGQTSLLLTRRSWLEIKLKECMQKRIVLVTEMRGLEGPTQSQLE